MNASDIGTALVALKGTIVTAKKSIDALDFFAPSATASTVLDPDELVREILIPNISNGTRQKHLKFTLRKPIDFPLVGMASLISVNDEVCTDALIALGGVASAPFRARAAEASLIGRSVTGEFAAEAAQLTVLGTTALQKNAYKIQITRALVKKAIMQED